MTTLVESQSGSLSQKVRRLIAPFLVGTRGRLARASMWSVVATVGGQGFALLASIACARLLGANDFGKLSIVRSTVTMLGMFAGASLGLAATKFTAQFRSTDQARAGRVMGLLFGSSLVTSSLVTLGTMLAAHPLALSIGAADLTAPLRIGAVLMITNTLAGVQIGALAGFEDYRALAGVTAIDGFLNLICSASGAFMWGVPGALAGAVIAALINFVIKHVMLQRIAAAQGIRFSIRGSKSEIHALWQVALPSLIAGVAIQPFDWLARIVLIRRAGSFAELGVFAAAYSLAQLVFFVPSQISGPVIPILSNLVGTRDVRNLRKLIFSTQWLVFGLALAAALPLILFSKLALATYGGAFVRARIVLAVLALSSVAGSPSLITRAVFTASSRLWQQAGQTAVWGLLLVAGAFFFARDGAVGLALAYLCAWGLFSILQLVTQRSVVRSITREEATCPE